MGKTDENTGRHHQELDVETFRTRAAEELNEYGEYMAGWLDGLLNEGVPAEDRRPWTRTGRVFTDFYDTLYQVLAWYKPAKMSRFRNLGWKIDDAMVDNIRSRLAEAIGHALATRKGGRSMRGFGVTMRSRWPAIPPSTTCSRR